MSVYVNGVTDADKVYSKVYFLTFIDCVSTKITYITEERLSRNRCIRYTNSEIQKKIDRS